MNGKTAVRILLLASILVGVALRVVGVSGKVTLSHDEGISYLAATGHQAEYTQAYRDRSYPVGHWVPASEWKRFIEPDEFFCFRKIASDLAEYDYHPPLFFWLLHIWVSVFGVSMWAGTMLNFLLLLLSAVVLLKLAHHAFGDSLEATAVVAVWIMSPFAIQVTTEVRQYELLGLCSLVLMWRTIRYVETGGRASLTSLAAICFVCLAGALTQYYFALVVLGCSVLVTCTLMKHNALAWVRFHLAPAVAYAVFLLSFPALKQLGRARKSEAEPVGVHDAILRLKTVATTVSQFFIHDRVGDAFLVLLAIALMAGALLILLKRPSSVERTETGSAKAIKYGLFFFVWNLGSLSLLYVAGLSPSYAMASKYLAFVWPLVGFIPVMLIRLMGVRLRVALLIGLCLWQVFYAAVYTVATLTRVQKRMHPATLLNSANAVLVDSVSRGVLPRIFFMMSDDRVVFAERQENLMANQDKWLEELPENSVYVSHLSYGNTLEQQAVIVSAIEERHTVRRVKSGIYNCDFFRIRP